MQKKRLHACFSIEEKKHNEKSQMVFKGRTSLVGFYQENGLSSTTEEKTGIDLPDQKLLICLSEIMDGGLEAAANCLIFSPAGINIGFNETNYSHQSREKFAILYHIVQFEIGQTIQLTPIVKDEMMRIKRTTELVDWINNLKIDKNLARFFTAHPQHEVLTKNIPLLPAIPNEDSLNLAQLSNKLNICVKTIQRNPMQFPHHIMGARKFYYLSECKPKYK